MACEMNLSRMNRPFRKGVLELVAGAGDARPAEQGVDADTLLVALRFDQVAGRTGQHGKELPDPLLEAGRLGQPVQLPAVVEQRQVQMCPGQRDPRELLADVAELRVGGPQELAPGRRLIEEVPDLDRRADVAAARADGAFVTAVDLEAVRLVGLPRSTDGPDASHGGDAGQGLAAKAERGDAVQVLDTLDLAGRVGFEGGGQILRIHAGAVIDDGDELAAAVLDGYGDLRGPCVDAVLDQLLDHARRPLDDLAGGDQVYHVPIKLDDSTHKRDTVLIAKWCGAGT